METTTPTAQDIWDTADNGYPTQDCRQAVEGQKHEGHNFQIYRNGTQYRHCNGR